MNRVGRGQTVRNDNNVVILHGKEIELPATDNTSEGLKILRAANAHFRTVPWPEPFNRTTHSIKKGDARVLSHIPDASIDLVVTSPPYWTLKEYNTTAGQLGDIEDYETFLDELDKVWGECARVLVPGGRGGRSRAAASAACCPDL